MLELSKKDIEQALKDTKGSFRDAAKILGVHRDTVRNKANKYNINYNSFRLSTEEQEDTKVEFPVFPEDDIPAEEIIDIMCKRFEKRLNNYESKKWMEFKIDTDKPIGICWFGDPHLDDNGCNWVVLKEHINICKNTKGMYGANIGDSTNNWVGRLGKLYANQDTSEDTAWKLVDWLFKSSGVEWLIALVGNHDEWQNSRYLKSIAKNICPMVDWRAQFKLVFNNGAECLIDAAHDHNGQSQWNPLHAQQKASVMGGIADLYIAGHRHNWALATNECPQTNRVYHLARARGYKFMDSYSDKLGFGSQRNGCSIVTIIDPKAYGTINFVKCFADVKEGADYLTYLRGKK